MKTKNLLIMLGIIFVGLIGIILFLIFKPLSLMEIPVLGLQEKTFIFAGVEGIATSTYFGSISSSQTGSFQLPVGGRMGFCGDNDGDISISNSISGGATLSLSSSISAHRQPCSGNGVEAVITLPAGTLTATCRVSANEVDSEKSIASCSIKGFPSQRITIGGVSGPATSLNFGVSYAPECARGRANLNDAFWFGNCISPKSQTFILNLDEQTTIDMSVVTSVGTTGSSSASLTLNFEEKDPCEGITCSNYCEDSIKNYNGRCVSGECTYTSQNCSFGCTDGECNISPPPPPKPGIIQFFVNIWDWIKGLFS